MTVIHKLAGVVFIVCLGLGLVGSADNVRGWLAKRDVAERLRTLGPGQVDTPAWRAAIDASTTPEDPSPWTRSARNATIVVADQCPSCDAALDEWLAALAPRQDVTVDVVFVGERRSTTRSPRITTGRNLVASDALAFSVRTGVLTVPLLMLEGDLSHDGCVLIGRGAEVASCDTVAVQPTAGAFAIPVFFGDEQSPLLPPPPVDGKNPIVGL